VEKIYMAKQQKPDVRRGEMAFIFAIVIGLAIGDLIKRVRVWKLDGILLWFCDRADRLVTHHPEIKLCKHRITIRRHSLKTGITGIYW